MDRASLESYLSRGMSLEAIGRRFGRHESTVAYWVQQHGLTAAHRDQHSARGALDEITLRRLVEEGASIAEIAVAVDRSKTTVRHWLARFGLKTRNARSRCAKAKAQDARAAGMAVLSMRCPMHGETEFWLDGRGCYRCKRCRSEAVTRRRRKVKAILVQEAGGACAVCGYAGNMRALHFHHVDPASKRLGLSAKGVSLSLVTLRAEAQKCVLLCSNCHAEVEDGTASVPRGAEAVRAAG